MSWYNFGLNKKEKTVINESFAPIEVGKVVAGQQSAESYRVDPQAALTREGRGLNTDVTDLKFTNADELLEKLSVIDPDVSAGLWNFLRLASSGLKVTGLGTNGLPSSSIQKKVNLLIQRLGQSDFKNWSIPMTIEQTANQMAKYALLRGAIATETVLGKDRKLYSIQVIDPISVFFKQPAKGQWMPYQKTSTGTEVSLAIPTFFWSLLDPKANSPYETPPLLPAIQAVLFNMAVMQDLQRIVKRVAFPRISIKIIEQTLRKFAPPETQADPAKMTLWLSNQKKSIGESLKTLAPEDAAVFFDSLEIGMLETKTNATVDYAPLIKVIDQRVITGLKTLPTILGRQFGSSQTLSGIEAMLYAKSVNCVQQLVADNMSRMLSLALRLEGSQGSVRVTHRPVSLRPDNELEAFKALQQARVLRNLSLGFITDEQAAEELTGDPYLPAAFTTLSGTNFYPASNQNVDAASVDNTRNPTAEEAAGAGRDK